MGLTLFLTFFKGMIAGLWVSIPLGPVGILLVQRTMNKGAKAGFISGLGVATADTVFAIVAAFGLTFLSGFLEDKRTLLTLVGGVVLFFLGLKLLKSTPSISTVKKADHTHKSKITDFISMFFLTITNPITILIFGPVLAILGIGMSDGDVTTSTIVTLGIYSGATLWWFLLTSGVNSFKHKIKLKNIALINKITGIVIIVAAVAAAISSLHILL